jgi:hypothetical protein
MITNDSAKVMDIAALHYARLDLRKTIEIQERGEREAPGTFLKLGQYWDEFHAVIGEISARQRAVR